MAEIITRRIIKPGDCVIGFGIPTSLKGFRRAQANPANKDFVVNCCPDVRDYQREVIGYTDRLLPVMTALGATVVRDLTLSDFREFFRRGAPVIILFAHWNADSIEFDDGLAGVGEVVEAVPPSFDGVIDLCVCHPRELALELRRLRRECVVRFIERDATPAFWLYFYIVVFKKLAASRMTYLEAVESTIVDFIDGFRRTPCRDYKQSFRNFFARLGL